jgi:hypothetical protein
VLQGLQALSPRQWPPLGAFIKLLALRVVHDLGIGFLLLVSLVVSAVLSALSGFFSHLFPSPWLIHVWQIVNLVLSLGVITVLFAMLSRFLPDTEVLWRERFTPTATGHVPPGDGPALPALAGSDEHGSCCVSSTMNTSTIRTQEGTMRP